MISSRVKDALDSWDFRDATAEKYDTFYEALAAVVEAAEKASAEIQSQHQMWPGEVDDLADALTALELALGECGV